MQAAKAFLLRGFVSFVSFAVMLVLLLLPNIDYDSAFRLHVALDFRYVFYIHGVNFLPAYQLLFLLGTNLAKHSLAYRIFRVVMFPGIILVFAVGWVLYVTGKKYEKPPSPVPVRTDLNTPDTLFETPDKTNLSVQ